MHRGSHLVDPGAARRLLWRNVHARRCTNLFMGAEATMARLSAVGRSDLREVLVRQRTDGGVSHSAVAQTMARCVEAGRRLGITRADLVLVSARLHRWMVHLQHVPRSPRSLDPETSGLVHGNAFAAHPCGFVLWHRA